MKNFTKLPGQFTLIFALLIIIINSVSAQTTHDVAVSDFKFEPATSNIAVGDIVKWTNNQGNHSINGSTATFPNNPASFNDNGGATNWTFSFTFSTQGVYKYQCGLHGSSMSGTINVGDVTGNEDVTLIPGINRAFPNPTNGDLYFLLPEKKGNGLTTVTLSVYNTNGKRIDYQIVTNDKPIHYNTIGLPNGIYLYKIFTDGEIINSGKFIKTQ